MALILPHPGQPTNGSDLDASIVQENITAIAQAVQSFDASQVAAGTLTANAFAASINPNTILKETTSPFVSSGCIWSTVSGLQGTMSSGVVYVNGIRTTVNAVSSYNFTASQDTYVDIDYNGNLYYLPVGNNAAAPALTANSVRVARIITNGTAIATIDQFGIDSLVNFIYPRKPGTHKYQGGWRVIELGAVRKYIRTINVGTVSSVAGGNSQSIFGGIAAPNANFTESNTNLIASIKSGGNSPLFTLGVEGSISTGLTGYIHNNTASTATLTSAYVTIELTVHQNVTSIF